MGDRRLYLVAGSNVLGSRRRPLPNFRIRQDWPERIDFSDPRRRVLAELDVERKEILARLRSLRRVSCDRRTPAERDAQRHELRQALYQIRKAMLALRATFGAMHGQHA